MKNDAGMRKVAPRSAGNGGQTEQVGLTEWKAQVEHLHGDDAPSARRQKRHQQVGNGIHRLRLAMALPLADQKVASSGRQSAMSAWE